MRKLLYSKPILWLLRLFFGLFYQKKYLRGYYFDTKRMGWFWALKGLRSRLFGTNRRVPWPVHPHTIISNPDRIHFDVDNLNLFQTPGCYWQTHDASITVGSGSFVAPNVGIITTNHDVNDPAKHVPGKDIVIGKKCWIGMNAVVLPGVTLGDHTVVAAGAVVTHSFPDGYCVVGGVPAKVISVLERPHSLENTANTPSIES